MKKTFSKEVIYFQFKHLRVKLKKKQNFTFLQNSKVHKIRKFSLQMILMQSHTT